MSNASKPRPPIGLIVSLAVNALLVGLILGAIGGRGDAPTHSSRGPAEIRFARDLVQNARPRDRRAIRRSLRDAWRDAAPLRSDVRSARARLQTEIAADPYDVAAVEAAFAELRAAEDALRASIHQVVAAELQRVPADRRMEAMDGERRGGPQRDRR